MAYRDGVMAEIRCMNKWVWAESRMYRIYCDDSRIGTNVYNGMDLDELRFSGHSEAAVFLAIYTHFCKHSDDEDVHLVDWDYEQEQDSTAVDIVHNLFTAVDGLWVKRV